MTLNDDKLFLLLQVPPMQMDEVIKRLRLLDEHSAEVKTKLDHISQQFNGIRGTYIDSCMASIARCWR